MLFSNLIVIIVKFCIFYFIIFDFSFCLFEVVFFEMNKIIFIEVKLSDISLF